MAVVEQIKSTGQKLRRALYGEIADSCPADREITELSFMIQWLRSLMKEIEWHVKWAE